MMPNFPAFEITVPKRGVLFYSCPVCNHIWSDVVPESLIRELRRHTKHEKSEWLSAWQYGIRQPFICP